MNQNDAILSLANRYCWDMPPEEFLAGKSRVILRVMDIGDWDDCLLLEKIFQRSELALVLKDALAGSLRPRSWSFWHYRLGLIEPGQEPPPMPVREVA